MESYVEIYSKSQANQIETEFLRVKDECYLEHAGATLYSDVQIAKIFKDLSDNVYGNPHAFNISSKFTGDTVDQIRYKVLEYFGTTIDEYSLIFTSGATSALKLVAECFDYRYENSLFNDGIFLYFEDNHTSVIGMREYAKNYKILSHKNAFELFRQENRPKHVTYKNNSLFVYPAQCNFSGTKYPLAWIKKIHNGALNDMDGIKPSNWFCMLDAASFVSTSKLNLNLFTPDFVCLSFYKIFGYPTGLGALLVKKSSAHTLQKKYFGGGTIQITLPTYHIPRTTFHERFEDGTNSFLSILSLHHGFQTFTRLNLTTDTISAHTFSLARYLHHQLLITHHANGNPLTVLYHDTDFENCETQGAIVNFNLLRDNGDFVGYSEVLQAANLYKIHLRTGCFCNPGACQRHLNLSHDDVINHFNEGHICGDQNDLIDGYPTGSIRVSFGYMSKFSDARKLIEMIEDFFVSKPLIKKVPSYWTKFQKEYSQKFMKKPKDKHEINICGKTCDKIDNKIINNNLKDLTISNNCSNTFGKVTNIFIYPIKSCRAFAVSDNWIIRETGFKFDREWMIVTSSGVCLTQKQETRLCLLQPNIKLKEGTLQLEFPDMPTIAVKLAIDEDCEKSEVTICQSKVCGDQVTCLDCGDEVSNWLSECLCQSDLRLLRQISTHSRKNKKGIDLQLSLANEAQFLLINRASVKQLAESIPDVEKNCQYISNLSARFRANFIIDTDIAFIENRCQNIKIGTNQFKIIGPCTRCQMICIDQETGQKTIEPLRTISLQNKGKIHFGVYLTRFSSTDTTISLSEKVIFE